MINPRLVPTPLVNPATRRVAIVGASSGPRRLATALWVGRWTLSLVRSRLRGSLTAEDVGARVRALAEQLGGLWVKVGQLASLRIDVFGMAFCGELAKLQDTGTGFPVATARAIVEHELGAPIDQVFEWFDPAPIAAASIGQVHRARLREGGDVVAVKVQRPGIADRITRQLALVQRVAAVADRLGVLPQLAWRAFAWEIREVLYEEIDYRYEAANGRRMRRTLRPHGIYAPRVYTRYSTTRVLTTEFIEGSTMNEYIASALKDPDRTRAWLHANAIDPQLVARRLTLSLLRQILEDDLFHGDLHPGNIVLLRNSRVALIDFGAVSSTEHEYLEKFTAVAQALTTRDFVKAAELTLLMCGELPAIDLAPVIADLVRVTRAWTIRTLVGDLPFHQKSLNSVYSEVTTTLIRHHCILGWAFLRIRRAQETLDASLLVLHPEANPTEMTEAYFDEARRRAVGRASVPLVGRRLAIAAAEAQQTMNDLAETSMFQFELIRRRAQVFAAQSGRVVSVAATAVGWTAAIASAGCATLALSWGAPDLFGFIGGAGIDTPVRVIILAAAAELSLSSFRLWSRLRRTPVPPIPADVRV